MYACAIFPPEERGASLAGVIVSGVPAGLSEGLRSALVGSGLRLPAGAPRGRGNSAPSGEGGKTKTKKI
eukprot:34057-Pyramimonas_sp.AAC.1